MSARQIWAVVELLIGCIGLLCVLGGLFAIAYPAAAGKWFLGGPILGLIVGGSLAFGGLIILFGFFKRNFGAKK